MEVDSEEDAAENTPGRVDPYAVARTLAIKDKEIGTVSWGNAVRAKAKKALKASEEAFMELGKILFVVWDTPITDKGTEGVPLYEVWGFSSFAEYAKNELHMDDKKAERLRKIWYVLEVVCEGIAPEVKAKLVGLGVSKLRELTRVLSPESASYWADRTEGLNIFDVRRLVQSHVSTDSPKRDDISDVQPATGRQSTDDAADNDISDLEDKPFGDALINENFKLYEGQRHTLLQAIEAAKRMVGQEGTGKKGHALELICTDFLANNDFSKNGLTRDKKMMVSKMERLLSLKLVAIDPKNGDIIYGMDTLKSMAGSEQVE